MIDCAPQLPYEVFVSDDRPTIIRAYVDGLRECGDALTALGATPAQVRAFHDMLDLMVDPSTKPLN